MPIELNLPVQNYPWGSTTAIPALRGVKPTGEPQAELWAGAHPDAPATLMVDGELRTLADVIADDPIGMLGRPIVYRFGGRLPYLLKILAIAAPLSIQVHPTTEQAIEGYERDDQAGIALDAPARSYRDRSAKPEMVVALSGVSALAGFREPAEAAEHIAELGVDSLAEVVAALRTGGVVALEAVVRHWLRGEDLAVLAGEVAKAATDADGELAGLVRALAERYPGDRGLLLALVLEPVTLAPGEAMFIGPGVPHAYLSGLAVEPQASSNNTLRAGLTGKHVNTTEVLRLLRYDEAPAVISGAVQGGRVFRYDPGAEEFVLDRVELGESVPSDLVGPRIVLCVEGSASVRAGGHVALGPGGAAFCPASDGTLILDGEGTAFVIAPRSVNL